MVLVDTESVVDRLPGKAFAADFVAVVVVVAMVVTVTDSVVDVQYHYLNHKDMAGIDNFGTDFDSHVVPDE